MSQLSAATRILTGSVDGVEAGAKKIADQRTSKAVAIAKELNGVLPDKVPTAQTSVNPNAMATQ